jgi:4-alpha-glucanotransferase
VLRESAALKKALAEYGLAAAQHQFRQFLFFRQWRALKAYANDRGIKLIGDVPIFVSSDSADVWAHPELFQLDARRRPTFVAGVPPDYFSKTGQLWGNPLYDWDALEKTGYAWWIARMRATLGTVDLIRLDHFRGFEAYWEIPAGNPTAEIGRWVKGPGDKLFHALKNALGGLPLIAEDLGVITPEVDALREQFHLPGMRILQFAFGGAVEDRFLPHHYERNTVVYTGTHDNETTRGWYEAAAPKEQAFCRKYLGLAEDATGEQAVRALIRLAWASVADLAVAPWQDILALGSEARMNLPGRASGNWAWRFRAEQLTEQRLADLADLTELFARSTAPLDKE